MNANDYNAKVNGLLEELAKAEDAKAAEMRRKADEADFIAKCEYLMEAERHEKKATEYRGWMA